MFGIFAASSFFGGFYLMIFVTLLHFIFGQTNGTNQSTTFRSAIFTNQYNANQPLTTSRLSQTNPYGSTGSILRTNPNSSQISTLPVRGLPSNQTSVFPVSFGPPKTNATSAPPSCKIVDQYCSNCPTEISFGSVFMKECSGVRQNHSTVLVSCLENGTIAYNETCQPDEANEAIQANHAGFAVFGILMAIALTGVAFLIYKAKKSQSTQ